MDKKKPETKKSQMNEAPKIPQIKVSLEETERILNQVFQDGFATIEFEVIPDKIKATLQSLSAAQQLQLEGYMNTVEGSAAFVLHTYTIQVLMYTMLSYGDKKFENPIEVENFLNSQPSIILDKLIKIQNSFEQQLKHVLQFEKINDHFFEMPSTLKK